MKSLYVLGRKYSELVWLTQSADAAEYIDYFSAEG